MSAFHVFLHILPFSQHICAPLPCLWLPKQCPACQPPGDVLSCSGIESQQATAGLVPVGDGGAVSSVVSLMGFNHIILVYISNPDIASTRTVSATHRKMREPGRAMHFLGAGTR